MKSQDLALIAIVGIISAVASLLLSNAFINTGENTTAKVEVAQPITSEFNRPSTDYFNQDSINPTQEITITENKNEKVFD